MVFFSCTSLNHSCISRGSSFLPMPAEREGCQVRGGLLPTHPAGASHWGKCAKRAEQDAAGTLPSQVVCLQLWSGCLPPQGLWGACASHLSFPGLALTPHQPGHCLFGPLSSVVFLCYVLSALSSFFLSFIHLMFIWYSLCIINRL